MKLFIVGENSDDKGSQLENLVKRILSDYELTNVTRDEVSAGGNEIDVTADIISNTGLSQIKIPVICECKAYEDAVSMPHWLKFLGKLYIAKRNHSETQGYFIALSGVNGNVWSNYKYLTEDLKDNSIHLIAKDELINIIESTFKLPDRKKLEDYISQFTNRHISEMSYIYYKNQVYWAIEFSDNTFTLFSDNKFISSDNIIVSRDLIKNIVSGNYVDIETEYKMVQRKLSLEGFCLCAVMLGYNSTDAIRTLVEKIQTQRISISKAEVDSILKKIPYIKIEKKIEIMLEKIEEAPIEFLRYLLNRPIIPKVITSCIYQSIINDKILLEISSVQKGLIIPNECKDSCLEILRLSPTALAESIVPVEFISNALKNSATFRDSTVSNNVNRISYERYFGMIVNCLQSDFENQIFWEILHNDFKIDAYSIIKQISINPNSTDSIILKDAPLIKLVNVQNIPGTPVIPIVEFDKSQIRLPNNN